MKRILSESKAGVWGNAFTTTITQQQKLTLFAVSDCLVIFKNHIMKRWIIIVVTVKFDLLNIGKFIVMIRNSYNHQLRRIIIIEGFPAKIRV